MVCVRMIFYVKLKFITLLFKHSFFTIEIKCFLEGALSSEVASNSARYSEGTRVKNCPGHRLPGFLPHEGAGQLYSCLGTYPAGECLTCRVAHS